MVELIISKVWCKSSSTFQSILTYEQRNELKQYCDFIKISETGFTTLSKANDQIYYLYKDFDRD